MTFDSEVALGSSHVDPGSYKGPFPLRGLKACNPGGHIYKHMQHTHTNQWRKHRPSSRAALPQMAEETDLIQ